MYQISHRHHPRDQTLRQHQRKCLHVIQLPLKRSFRAQSQPRNSVNSRSTTRWKSIFTLRRRPVMMKIGYPLKILKLRKNQMTRNKSAAPMPSSLISSTWSRISSRRVLSSKWWTPLSQRAHIRRAWPFAASIVSYRVGTPSARAVLLQLITRRCSNPCRELSATKPFSKSKTPMREKSWHHPCAREITAW